MYRALYLSPMIPTRDMDMTIRFFEELMLFKLVYRSDWYAIVEKDNLTLHLEKAGDDVGQMEFYLEVDDVDNLWTSIKDRVTELHYSEPFDQEYRMREFHVEVPATNCLMYVGQEIR